MRLFEALTFDKQPEQPGEFRQRDSLIVAHCRIHFSATHAEQLLLQVRMRKEEHIIAKERQLVRGSDMLGLMSAESGAPSTRRRVGSMLFAAKGSHVCSTQSALLRGITPIPTCIRLSGRQTYASRDWDSSPFRTKLSEEATLKKLAESQVAHHFPRSEKTSQTCHPDVMHLLRVYAWRFDFSSCGEWLSWRYRKVDVHDGFVMVCKDPHWSWIGNCVMPALPPN